MSSTVDQLHQLSNSELFIMCHKYQFAAPDIAYLTRRQLERRLHVAIVGERAKLRAQYLMHRVRSRKANIDFNAWLGVNGIETITHHPTPLPNHQMQLRNFSDRRQTVSLLNFQRFRGGVEPRLWLEQLKHYSEVSETSPQQDEINGSDSEIDEPEELTDEPKEQWRSAFENQLQPMEARSTDYIDWDAAVEQASDYYSLSESEESPISSNIHFLRIQESAERISNNIQMQKREERWRTISNQNFHLSPKNEVSLSQLQRAQRLWTPSNHDFPLPESDDEADSAPERLLCTYNYMKDLPSGDDINQQSKQELFDKGRGENPLGGDTLISTQINTTHRRTLWRYVFNILCCNSQGKLDAGKLRYSILCCAMVICTFVGFKLFQ